MKRLGKVATCVPQKNAIHIAIIGILALNLVTFASPSGAATLQAASVDARLASCDSAVVQSAIAELLRDPVSLREPLVLFQAALAARMAGRKEQAAFLYLAGRLRTARQIVFDQGDRPQLLAVMNMSVGPLVMPGIEADPELARKVVERVIKWDRSTPDSFRDSKAAKSGTLVQRLAEIDAGLAQLPVQIRKDGARAAAVHDASEQAERQIEAMYAERCGPGTLDSVDLLEASRRIRSQAEGLVSTHPLVIRRAGGALKAVSVVEELLGPSRLPKRLTLAVQHVTGQIFYAEVDVTTSITPGRKLGSVRMSLACISELPLGQRDASWKDACMGDPKAVKPG
jgi:hypothetical protein